MEDNIRNLIKELTNITYENGSINARIKVLHNLLDGEEVRCAERGYSPNIDTEVIRSIFGWSECHEARGIRQRKEAEKTKAEQNDEQ